jgi:hypothetical protein
MNISERLRSLRSATSVRALLAFALSTSAKGSTKRRWQREAEARLAQLERRAA